MKIFFTDNQYEIVVNLKNIHTNRISPIKESENAAIRDMLDGDDLNICQVCSLVDFFGRIIDFDVVDDLVIKSFVVYIYESLIQEKKRYFNI